MRKLTQMDVAVNPDEGRGVMDFFRLGIKSEETRKCYERKMRQILCDIIGDDVLQGNVDERAEQLVNIAKEDPESAVKIMLGLSRLLRERTSLPKTNPEYLNPSSMPNFFKPIKKLLKMNGVTINWVGLSRRTPRSITSRNRAGGRGRRSRGCCGFPWGL
ncbi:MAG: hypothetical protein MPJ05_07045 [Nitrosopumilus sp.]|nr:hypothetical protein [Nitrosopumilus sp.]